MKDQQKVINFSGEEFIKIAAIGKEFTEKGKSQGEPQLVILMGGIGSGKTTMRKQKFNEGFVNFDFGEIYNRMRKEVGEDGSKATGYAALAADLILEDSVKEKKNIVIETIGDNDLISPVIDAMTKLGYKVSINFIEAEQEEAYQRHLKAAKEDENYFSAYFTQAPTLSSFYNLLGLGEINTE